MLTLRELRIKDIEKNDEVKIIKNQEKRMEVCRVQQTMNGPPKLILTKPLCVSNAMQCLINMDISPISKLLFLCYKLSDLKRLLLYT
jgi:hypothetical protein